jgi:hypothetical protein
MLEYSSFFYVSTLSLFMSRVRADDEHHAAAANNLAVFTNPLYAGPDLHGLLLCCAIFNGKIPKQTESTGHSGGRHILAQSPKALAGRAKVLQYNRLRPNQTRPPAGNFFPLVRFVRMPAVRVIAN